MTRLIAAMSAIFSLFSRNGAFAFVSPFGRTGSLSSSHNSESAARLQAQANRRVVSYRPRMALGETAGEAVVDKKAVFGGGCFW